MNQSNMDDSQQIMINSIMLHRYQVQENAIFLDFNRDQIINNLDNYKTLNIYMRTALVKNIASLRDITGPITSYCSFILQLAADCEEIQQQLIKFLSYLFAHPLSNIDYHREFIEPLVIIIKGTHMEIKEQSCRLLSEVVHRLTVTERKEVMKLSIQLENGEDQEGKIISIQLIAKLSHDLPKEQAEKYFKTDYLKMYDGTSVRIKKQVLQNIPILAECVSHVFLDQQIIMDYFPQRCREKVWGIRKVCVQMIPKLVKLTKHQKQTLSNLLFNFTKDSNKIVKITAFKIIPQFIANYGSSNVPNNLIQIYQGLIDNDINEHVSRQDEIVEKVAYYFPGVINTLGAGKWQSMKGVFNRLLHYKINAIKQPIAASLHQICRIIGPDYSREYMFSALDSILKQPSQSLKMQMLSHLSQFVAGFDSIARQNLIDVCLMMQTDSKRWRVRYQIAKQLTRLAIIYQTQAVFKYIFPITLKLCSDSITEVRLEAANHMHEVIQNLQQNDVYQQMALVSIKGFGVSQKFLQRKTFAYMISSLYKLKAFNKVLMNVVVQLSQDKIINVRIAVAISISQILKENKHNKIQFAQAIDILMKDEQQVRQYLE